MRTKEQQIAAQSSLRTALDFAKLNDYKLELTDLIGISIVMEDYVENGYSPKLREKLERVQEHVSGKNVKV